MSLDGISSGNDALLSTLLSLFEEDPSSSLSGGGEAGLDPLASKSETAEPTASEPAASATTAASPGAVGTDASQQGGWQGEYNRRMKLIQSTTDPALKAHYQAELDVLMPTLIAMGIKIPQAGDTSEAGGTGKTGAAAAPSADEGGSSQENINAMGQMANNI